MASRYERLYEAPKNQYCIGSSFIVEAGAITRDNNTNKLIIQLKIRNIDDKVIKGAKVTISLLDTVGDLLNEEITYEYLDLNCGCGNTFGSKTPIFLNTTSARSFKITNVTLMFSDNSKIETSTEKFVTLTSRENLREAFEKEEYSEYIKRISSSNGINTYPEEKYDLWVCSCGTFNKLSSEICYNCKNHKKQIFNLDKNELRYNYASGLMKKGKFSEAIIWFEKTSGYKDSENQIKICKEKLEEIKAKEEADRLEAQRKAEERRIAAEKAAKKRKKIVATITSIITFALAFAVLLQTVILPKINYLKMKNYSAAKVGDYVYFGSYEQDNNAKNGKEAIEWLVLDKKEDRMLLISKNALDYLPYNTKDKAVTWEKCTLRKWLNYDFYNSAFNSKEQDKIETTKIKTYKNAIYGRGANSSKDKVFLLSINEANKYFSENFERRCSPTTYAIGQGAITSDSYFASNGETTSWWWLRTSGALRNSSADVYAGGVVSYSGCKVTYNGCVRPALWISLK